MPTLRPKYIPYTYMDPLGFGSGLGVWGLGFRILANKTCTQLFLPKGVVCLFSRGADYSM